MWTRSFFLDKKAKKLGFSYHFSLPLVHSKCRGAPRFGYGFHLHLQLYFHCMTYNQALLFANEYKVFSISFSCKLCAYALLWWVVALIEHCGLWVGSLLSFSIAYESSIRSHMLDWGLYVEFSCVLELPLKLPSCVCVCFGIERGEHCSLDLCLLMKDLHAPSLDEWGEYWKSIGECVCVVE